MFQNSFRVFQGCFEEVLREFQGIFQEVLKIIRESFRAVWIKFLRYFKKVSGGYKKVFGVEYSGVC